MKWTEYVIEARKFDHTADWPQSHRFLHAFTGIVSDYGELVNATSPGNRVEEMGDVCWYLHILCDLAHVEDIETLNLAKGNEGSVFFPMANTGKRWFVAGKVPSEAQLVEHVRGVVALLIDQSVGINFHEMLAKNIEKLNLRTANNTKNYAQTADEAARDRAAEAAIFES
jgi:hypothetical protein